jgi:O-antigen/teichoic acid export membrane protein
MSTAENPETLSPEPLPPVLGRLLSGTFWIALRSPLQIILGLWSVRLILDTLGAGLNDAYYFAWSFGFLQFLLEFGMTSALQRQVSDCWTRGDRDGTNRTIACGMTFYTVMALTQIGILLGIAYLAVPVSGFAQPPYRRFVLTILWLQILAAPCFGLTTVVSSVLQAARRYDYIPRLEFLIVLLRFGALIGGVWLGVPFLLIVTAQVVIQIGLSLGPALWVMTRELGYVPTFLGATWKDFRGLFAVSSYVSMIQLSVVLSDSLDKAVLGFALPDQKGPTSIYEFTSKAFMQIRQTGWMLSYLVMPAAASLIAAKDDHGLERIKYDGSRTLMAVLTPLILLAWIDARPFLSLWVGSTYASQAWLMRLFLVATAPLVISILVQIAIGMGRIKVIALAALGGAIVNLPLSWVLTVRFGDASGVIWGTVLTTLVSNLVVPGIYVFRVLRIRPAEFFTRVLVPPICGALALIAACGLTLRIFDWTPPWESARLIRWLPLVVHVMIGVLAYGLGYLIVPTGRGDLASLRRKLRRRRATTGG